MWDYEKAHLEQVANEIKKQLSDEINAASNYRKEAIDTQKRMWQDVGSAPTSLSDLDNAAQLWHYQTEISSQARKYRFSYDKIERLKRLYKNPYFGRIDFLEEGEKDAEQIYIGIHNLRKSGSVEIIVYDWRAPISSMFYDYEIGFCGYDSPGGPINGQMLLKRQYKIEDLKIVYMFESSLSINDEMLQELLGKSTDDRMRTIVTSIQREQNTVIRNSKDKILIVEGPAGSGKTSIALHRAAYILYKYRDSIKSEDILIFSPNHVFEDYISNVLPELGEENIQRSTFADYFGKLIDEKYRVETMELHMENVLSDYCKKVRLQSIKLKGSLQFLNILKKYVQYLENGMSMRFNDLVYNSRLVIRSEEIYKLFRDDYSRFSFGSRVEKLRSRLFYLLGQYEEERVQELIEKASNNLITEEEKNLADQKAKIEYESVKNDIIQMTSYDINTLYIDLFYNIELFTHAAGEQEIENIQGISNYTIRQLNQNIINYEDIAPIVYLKSMLGVSSEQRLLKHIIIDEAQDYTPIQYEIFKKVFRNCNMTILGDINQSINRYMNIGDFESITDTFDEKYTRSISLTKSYRSSKEIADFCREIIKPKKQSEQLNRQGSKPVIVKVDKGNLYKKIENDINILKSRNNKLIAIICKTANQCEKLYNSLESHQDISLISNQNELYHGGVVIIPSYLAKGLEFDAVLVHSIENNDYSEEDRRLLYTICSRALHELYMYYFDNMSKPIEEIDKNLYTMEIDNQ